MWPYFTYNSISYNLRKGSILYLPSTDSTYHGTNSVHFRGSLIWNNLPRDIKSGKSLFQFKTKIMNLRNIDWGCVIDYIDWKYCLQFLDGHFTEGLSTDGQFPEDIYPMEISPTGSSPKDSSSNRRFAERIFPQRTVLRIRFPKNSHFPAWTFLQITFFIYFNLYLTLVYQSSHSQ